MAYSNTWSTTRPLGSAQANTADDEIRALRLDLQERFNDFVFEDMSVDPLVIKQSSFGGKDDKKIVIPYTSFIIEPSESNAFEYNTGFVTVNANVQPVKASLLMAIGTTIKRLEWLVSTDDSALLSLRLRSGSFEAPSSVTDDATSSKTSSGQEIVDSGDIGVQVDGQRYFWLEADKQSDTAAFSIWGVRVTYSAADGRSTL
jgi:hypothetical protein